MKRMVIAALMATAVGCAEPPSSPSSTPPSQTPTPVVYAVRYEVSGPPNTVVKVSVTTAIVQPPDMTAPLYVAVPWSVEFGPARAGQVMAVLAIEANGLPVPLEVRVYKDGVLVATGSGAGTASASAVY